MTCQNPSCGRELVQTMLVCRSNEPPGASCGERRCPGLRFCSVACLSACWRAHNRFPQVSYVEQPAIDEVAAAREARRIAETARLERLWADGERAA